MIDPRFYSCSDGGLAVADLSARLDLSQSFDGSFGEARVYKPAPLSSSTSGDISFLSGKRALDQLETAGATACFVTKHLAPKVADRNIIPLITAYPKFALSKATSLLVTDRRDDTAPDADIASDADIHDSVVIGPGTVIGSGVRIGPNSVIQNAIIGQDCQIGACTVIGGSGFGVAPGPENQMISVPHVGRVIIGSQVRIGSNVCIDRGQLGDTIIGDGSQIDNLVQVAHNCVLGKNVVLAGRVGLSGSCKIGDGVQMGGSVGIADHVTIGDGARLAAYAGVMHDVPAGETWSGIPAQPIRDHMKLVAMARKSLKK